MNIFAFEYSLHVIVLYSRNNFWVWYNLEPEIILNEPASSPLIFIIFRVYQLSQQVYDPLSKDSLSEDSWQMDSGWKDNMLKLLFIKFTIWHWKREM